MKGFFAGVDVGGTNIKAMITNRHFQVICKDHRSTQPIDTDTVVQNILNIITDLLTRARIGSHELAAIGIAFPGIVDTVHNRVVRLKSIPWIDLPIADIIRSRFGNVPVFLENDGNAGLIGENHFGSAQGCSDIVMLTLGTGIGGGIMTNGNVLSGANHFAGEMGHMVIENGGIQCTCGKSGCFQAYASANATATYARSIAAHNPGSILWRLSGGDLQAVTAAMVAQGAASQDPLCCRTFERLVRYLSIGISNYICIFNPEIVVIGGGLSKAGDLLLVPLRKQLQENWLMHPLQSCRIERALLNEWAGSYGACVVAAQAIGP